MREHRFKCFKCKRDKTHTSDFTTGYGEDAKSRKFCWSCIGEMDWRTMREKGHSKNLPLYLTAHDGLVGKGKVTNWPGTLSFPIRGLHKGAHNIAGTRYDFWFTDKDGQTWHGVQYGEYTQIAHCRRVRG